MTIFNTAHWTELNPSVQIDVSTQERLVARLTEADLPTDIFVPLDGKESYTSHQDRSNQVAIDSIQGQIHRTG